MKQQNTFIGKTNPMMARQTNNSHLLIQLNWPFSGPAISSQLFQQTQSRNQLSTYRLKNVEIQNGLVTHFFCLNFIIFYPVIKLPFITHGLFTIHRILSRCACCYNSQSHIIENEYFAHLTEKLSNNIFFYVTKKKTSKSWRSNGNGNFTKFSPRPTGSIPSFSIFSSTGINFPQE